MLAPPLGMNEQCAIYPAGSAAAAAAARAPAAAPAPAASSHPSIQNDSIDRLTEKAARIHTSSRSQRGYIPGKRRRPPSTDARPTETPNRRPHTPNKQTNPTHSQPPNPTENGGRRVRPRPRPAGGWSARLLWAIAAAAAGAARLGGLGAARAAAGVGSGAGRLAPRAVPASARAAGIVCVCVCMALRYIDRPLELSGLPSINQLRNRSTIQSQGSPLLVLLTLGFGIALYSGAALGCVESIDPSMDRCIRVNDWTRALF